MLDGYETLVIYAPQVSDKELAEMRVNSYRMALDAYLENSEGKTEVEKEIIWHILTTRGENKLIFGPNPFSR